MTLYEPTATTAAVTACVSVALVAGHWLGDHPVQSDADAATKGRPSEDQLADGVQSYTGWRACLRHVSSYLACQAVALALVAFVAPLTVFGAVTALVISGSTHAVVDRRWIVRAIINAKGSHDWAEGPYLVDQSLHYGAMFVAAIAAAVVTTGAGMVAVLILAEALVVACFVAEHRAGLRALAARRAELAALPAEAGEMVGVVE